VKTTTLILCCLLASCGMTPTQKKYTAIGLSVLAVGMIAAHDDDDGPAAPMPDIQRPPNPCVQNPSSCQ
jgi:hypothetical protein